MDHLQTRLEALEQRPYTVEQQLQLNVRNVLNVPNVLYQLLLTTKLPS